MKKVCVVSETGFTLNSFVFVEPTFSSGHICSPDNLVSNHFIHLFFVHLFPAYVTFFVSLLIYADLYARHQQTVEQQAPDFNPNHSVCLACVSCCEMSQTV